jgi:hypothetical protein
VVRTIGTIDTIGTIGTIGDSVLFRDVEHGICTDKPSLKVE